MTPDFRACFSLFALLAAVPAFGAAAPSAPAAARPDNSHVDGPAMVRDWTPPVYPADALADKVGGRVSVRIIVDPAGAVTSARVLHAPDDRLGEAALTAVKLWKFSPAVDREQRVACCLDVPFVFDAAKGEKSWKKSLLPEMGLLPVVASSTAAVARTTPSGEYPASLVARRLPGIVRFACRVDAAGRVSAPQILATSHADFVLPALAAIARWEFSPAKQGDLAIASDLRGEVSFDELGGSRSTVLKANGITGPDGGEPAATPEPLVVTDPVWPYALLMEGATGEAQVEFLVTPRGDVTDVKLRSASHPEFGRAALAALETWQFEPAIRDGRRVEVPLLKKVEFPAVPADAAAAPSDDLAALVRSARAGTIDEARGLDEKLTPLFRQPPDYPAALLTAGRPSGEAQIEFIIARDGRARLPRILSATHDEFGWAAATAISQWIFKAPRRGGQPVDVRVRIPVTFTPPAQ